MHAFHQCLTSQFSTVNLSHMCPIFFGCFVNFWILRQKIYIRSNITSTKQTLSFSENWLSNIRKIRKTICNNNTKSDVHRGIKIALLKKPFKFKLIILLHSSSVRIFLYIFPWYLKKCKVPWALSKVRNKFREVLARPSYLRVVHSQL